MRLSIVKTADGHYAVVDRDGNEVWRSSYWLACVGFLNGYDAKDYAP